ncbi:MAG TPA: DUF488 domain-containing protein [Humisphaera sp.]|jgi:uncharacterized protein (DUF488 family)|nr:DUF488 domain-containing protein [Humisphaera sp.]
MSDPIQNSEIVEPAGTLFTIGHSTRTFEQLVELLKENGVAAIADVRLIPRSRRYPHFNDEFLAANLPTAGIAYFPFKSLGGRRRPAKDSPNTGWRNESFRGYADFLQTPPFERALGELIELARGVPTATMCAEAVRWRCHRSLISDALVVRGWRVLDIMGRGKVTPHHLTSFARVEGTKIVYPDVEDSDGLFA